MAINSHSVGTRFVFASVFAGAAVGDTLCGIREGSTHE